MAPLKQCCSLTRFTASSHAFFSSVVLALFTFTTSLVVDGTAIERGPIGRSDSEEGDLARLALELSVRVELWPKGSSDSGFGTCFLCLAIGGIPVQREFRRREGWWRGYEALRVESRLCQSHFRGRTATCRLTPRAIPTFM